MARRYQARRRYVSCGKCGANYGAEGPDPRCPACNARLADYEPQEVRPAISSRYRDLEGPDFPRDEAPVETAPWEEFAAAGLVLVAFILMVAAVAMRSPDLLTGGMGLFGLTGLVFGIIKIKKFAGRKRTPSEYPSNFDWLIGRGSILDWRVGRDIWDRRRKQ